VVGQLAAVSCGIVDGEVVLDLPYPEDSKAEVDMNIVMNEKGEYLEVQGTGEGRSFTPDELTKMLSYAKEGIDQIMDMQKKALGEV
jgi:ribonuclease PH